MATILFWIGFVASASLLIKEIWLAATAEKDEAIDVNQRVVGILLWLIPLVFFVSAATAKYLAL